jgi:hypothetical protein
MVGAGEVDVQIANDGGENPALHRIDVELHPLLRKKSTHAIDLSTDWESVCQ